MLKVTFIVDPISTALAAGYTSIEAGRASNAADAAAQSGTFTNLGNVATLVTAVSGYDYLDANGARGQWYNYRLKKDNGSYSSWYTPVQGWSEGYLTVPEFRAYEMGDLNDFEGNPLPDSKLERFLGLASRAVDAYCGQHFGLEQVTERHRWKIATRRIYPRQGNIQSIAALRIYVSAGQKADFQLSDLFINSNENYVEVTSLATVTYSLFPSIVALGLLEPTAEITYVHGFSTTPQDIRDATAFLAVDLLGRDALVRQGSTGLNRLIIGETQMFFEQPIKGIQNQYMPAHAAALLDRWIKIHLR
jgi:hypothetical protein